MFRLSGQATAAIEDGRRVFNVRSGQFVIVVEGAPGISNQKVGTSLDPGADERPDIHQALLSLGCALIYWQSLRET